MVKNKAKEAKKSLLKKMVGGRVDKEGKSPFKMDNALGKTPLKTSEIGSGNGSNLGTNGIF